MPHIHDSDADAVIRRAGLRVTETRRAVLAAVRPDEHLGADDVFARVRDALPGTSLQSVYNALGDLRGGGLLRRIAPAGHPGRYERRVADNHHHLVCRSCGRIEDVDCVIGEAPCLQPDDTRGFVLDTADVTFWGLCAACAAPADIPQTPTKGTR